MAALFDGTTQYLSNPTAPITTFPFTAAAWAMMSGDGVIFGLSDTNTINGVCALRASTAKVEVTVNAGAGSQTGTVATADALGTWFFAIGRFISATNRRVAVLHAGGAIEHAQNTGSANPSGIDTVTIGATLATSASRFFGGLIGEWWWTNTDIQADGGQLDDNMVRQLAYHGPLSVPGIVPDIIEYHQMRSSLPSLPSATEDFVGKFGPQTWVNNAGARLGHHPPLPYEYDRPRPVARMLMI